MFGYKDTDLAWCAGIVDGEGSIGIVKNRDTRRLIMRVQMTHIETIKKLLSILKIGDFYTHQTASTSKNRDSYSYYVCGEKVISVIQLLLPYLFTKRPQALLALEFGKECFHKKCSRQRVSIEVEVKRELYAEEMALLNKRGKSIE